MFARKRLDIGWTDLACGLWATLQRPSESKSREEVETCWSDDAWVAVLSVRSGFDLLLSALDLPRGSEVLMSAVTIAHMAEIVRLHGLVPVPVDLEPTTLEVDVAALEAQVAPRTKAIVVAHLFGARLDLTPVAQVAQRHGLVLLEDCAQAFVGRSYAGQACSDVAMFSFGTIKTATAFGGGLMRCKDPALARRMNRIQASYAMQPPGEYQRKLVKYAALKALTTRPGFSAFKAAVTLGGGDYDAVITAAARGFPGSDLLAQIRRRPCPALLRLLKRRVTTYSGADVDARRAAGATLAALLPPEVVVPGVEAPRHTHWLFPVRSRQPERLILSLRRHGFDAARGASSLQAIEQPGQPPATRSAFAMSEVVYVPVYPPMTLHHLELLARLITRVEVGAERSVESHTGAVLRGVA